MSLGDICGLLGTLSSKSSQDTIPRAPAPSQHHGAQGSCCVLQSVLQLKTELENEFAIEFPSCEAAKASQWAEPAFAQIFSGRKPKPAPL